MSNKHSSKELGSLAAKILKDPNASKIEKELAGSVLSQTNTDKVTSKELESKASKVLTSEHCSDTVKSLAGSVLAQSKKSR
ncbi:hypothetical protein [[Haemophilus] ducreyi]|uniref:hypothetical protein n=1 Tax=Haemophilus ducreyi TaxID=730 RepID=UPI0006563EC4|nr:hypothetical protein [[Haemophilus] ducreyi]AKO45616.1 hypothetical protein RZ66_05125 [[Haemophilus] ducreyi]AKO47002.1 hypothetical protein RZ67_05035 [[Haemophilus] ducreyi]AKO48346.1 hypothetical protein RZ68_05020 [[Haemophilus] ducreyi]AKO49734.1 hypothetical protein RZ69_05060 [[Haemophilus] ducreyi]ANF61338.1 hypothetical protein A6037_00390 [[Haemophilus] ducreyi]